MLKTWPFLFYILREIYMVYNEQRIKNNALLIERSFYNEKKVFLAVAITILCDVVTIANYGLISAFSFAVLCGMACIMSALCVKFIIEQLKATKKEIES